MIHVVAQCPHRELAAGVGLDATPLRLEACPSWFRSALDAAVDWVEAQILLGASETRPSEAEVECHPRGRPRSSSPLKQPSEPEWPARFALPGVVYPQGAARAEELAGAAVQRLLGQRLLGQREEPQRDQWNPALVLESWFHTSGTAWRDRLLEHDVRRLDMELGNLGNQP
jgi:hypothetical protein